MSETEEKKRKSWYLWVLGIFVPPIAAIWMWAGKRGTKAARWLVTAWAIAWIIIGPATNFGGNSGDNGSATSQTAGKKTQTASKDTSNTKTTNSKTEKPEAKPATSKPAPEWKNETVSVENVQLAIGEAEKMTKTASTSEITSVQVLDNAGTKTQGDKIVWVKVKPDAVWNETDYAQILAQTMTAWSQKLFENPKVTMVRLWGMADFTDQYGKQSTQPAVKIEWSRATAKKIAWDNFRDMVDMDFKKAYQIADYYYFHPGMWKNLKDSDKKELPVEGGTNLY
ncbi:hypothetical protein [Alicyclobacillus shizuokensis]|uniref:hypothetical protein n=1 Tax=Alicyclobacillus shizuokensis TaxID=392014 RepID=UPI000832A782|nr:hypothetical protein [Alicyclobacillus shizuokensis]